MSDSKYRATVIVHWPTGPVDCCEEHANKLMTLGQMLATHVVKSAAIEGAQCVNCINEARKK